MNKTSIPTKDRELQKFALQGKAVLLADGANYGFDSDDINAIIGAVDEYDTSYREHIELHARARAARQRKDAARKKLKKILGAFISMMRLRPEISEVKFVALGVKPTDRVKTPINAPKTPPVFTIDYAQAWHILRFWEEGSERRRRKPKGVIGAEIYVNIGGERDDLASYRLQTTAVGGNHIFRYSQTDVGKQVHYYMVWITRRGARSPKSPIQSATIAT